MALTQGDVYECPDAGCGCQVTVTQPTRSDCPRPEGLTCCGNVMVKAGN